ncbi:hypothetical protein HPB50_010957 [Hyalomma asiaticum]|uniref:Uncharacterized protein n=1 Tax=Hyalomma asiaticum TaxID=266040 RepID=A0ACB7TI25_HYAAI|nr:hypothetical protein HPB50_010957 [Hyalomma asiaticum]
MAASMSNIIPRVSELEQTTGTLQKLVGKLDRQNDELENRLLKNNLIIHGLRETPSETTDHLLESVLDLLSAKLGVKWDDIERCHGLGAERGDTPRPRDGPTLDSGDEGSDHTAMASAALAALLPPPPFLATPGTPAIPWPRWVRLFEDFLLASGATDLPAPRRRALLLHCLGREGQRIFDALLPPSTAPQLPTTETLTTDTISTSAFKDRGGVSKQDSSATSLPDVYDVARELLAT